MELKLNETIPLKLRRIYLRVFLCSSPSYVTFGYVCVGLRFYPEGPLVVTPGGIGAA